VKLLKSLQNKILLLILFLFSLVGCFVTLFSLNLRDCKYLVNFVNNISFISETLVFLIVIFCLIFVYRNYKLKITNFSVFGVCFDIRNPDSISKSNIKNFLLTKRTLCNVSREHDNFYDVFSSYYNVYLFLREQLALFNQSESDKSQVYLEIGRMISELNIFLTKFQSNYRIWYEKEIQKEFVPIDKLQKLYPLYKELDKGFNDINEQMKKHYEFFGIKTFIHMPT
jgi:hypothetical protein